MSSGELRVAQIVPLDFTVYDQNESIVDVTGGSFGLKIGDPNGKVTTRSAALLNSGSDGKVTVTTDVDDFAMVGVHRLQLIVTLSGIPYPSDILEVEVYENLPDAV